MRAAAGATHWLALAFASAQQVPPCGVRRRLAWYQAVVVPAEGK